MSDISLIVRLLEFGFVSDGGRAHYFHRLALIGVGARTHEPSPSPLITPCGLPYTPDRSGPWTAKHRITSVCPFCLCKGQRVRFHLSMMRGNHLYPVSRSPSAFTVQSRLE